MMPLERPLLFRLPLLRGPDVRALQQALRRAGYAPGEADGIFGPRTRDALIAFQRSRGLAPDGVVGPRTWAALAEVAAPSAPEPAWQEWLRPLLPRLAALHGPPVGQGERRWRLTAAGVEVDGSLPASRDTRPLAEAWTRHGAAMCQAAERHGVPVELLLATAMTESSGRAEAVREEPGYRDEATTPDRLSAGLMQTLLSTAREVLGNPRLTRAQLLDPALSLAAGAAYIRRQAVAGRQPTGFDPPLVAIAYNAGSLRPADNPWGLVQTRRGDGWHADALVRFFNDAFALLRRDPPPPSVPCFLRLLAEAQAPPPAQPLS
ncbi:MAG: peptidoglycan-binding protein [Rhodovarius sp.]|nr:peptidoglycan-binding protein [Rhodovarius sp.]